MAKKLTVVLSVEHSDGPRLDTYDALAEYMAEEWEGLEMFFQDAGEDDETSVTLSVVSIVAD